MGRISGFQPHKLFVAALVSSDLDVDRVRRTVAERFGPIDSELAARPFTFSSYYDEEMGSGVVRTIFSIDPLVDPAELASLKERSNTIEAEHARPRSASGAQGRTINLDPGLLSLSRVILATTKASAHRIPIRDGLYAEITLVYRHGRYAPLEWTYPDYQSDDFVSWLGSVRTRYHEQLREIDSKRPWRL
ncbi:MAG: DUF4416 family protein [Spirochaetota bacterium]